MATNEFGIFVVGRAGASWRGNVHLAMVARATAMVLADAGGTEAFVFDFAEMREISRYYPHDCSPIGERSGYWDGFVSTLHMS